MKFEVVEKILNGDKQRQRYKQSLHVSWVVYLAAIMPYNLTKGGWATG